MNRTDRFAAVKAAKEAGRVVREGPLATLVKGGKYSVVIHNNDHDEPFVREIEERTNDLGKLVEYIRA